jgi:HPt (histidine-containing phosphotransfer) domain-containing protein
MVSTQYPSPSEVGQADKSCAPLDAGVIAALQMLDRSTTLEAVDNFMADTPGHLKTLNRRLGSSDGASFVKKCHGLQGSSARFGALRMASICGDLADFVDGNDMTSASRTLKLLEAEFVCVRRALAAAFDC